VNREKDKMSEDELPPGIERKPKIRALTELSCGGQADEAA